MTEHTGYNATLDPRTGRPVLPLDGENTRKAEDESQPLTEEDNLGIEMGAPDEERSPSTGEEESQNERLDEETQDDATSSVDINRTAPRMRAAEISGDDKAIEVESDETEMDKISDSPILAEQAVEGERPEALAKFAEVARNKDGRPVRDGVEAKAETAPIATDPTSKQDAATRVLREGVLKADQGADEAIDKLPDRTDVPGRRTP